MSDNVIFTGYMPNNIMPQLYASAYAFMTSSKTDVHPLVLLESFASGTPVIGIDAGGVGNLINKKNGLKFKNKDDLVRKLNFILDNAKEREKLSISSRKFAENYSWSEIAKRYKELYESLITNNVSSAVCGENEDKYPTKVSVIIPTYKEERYIGDTLRAIRKQTYPKYEIIVVDSNSPDKTRNIAKKYADKVINMKYRGVAKARNIGAKKASGDLYVFIDADTIIDRNFIEKIVKIFENDKSISGLFPRTQAYSKKSQAIFDLQNAGVFISTLFGFPKLPGTCVVYRKEFFEKTNGFLEEYITAEDIMFSLKNRKHGKLVYSNKVNVRTSDRRVRGKRSKETALFWIKNIPKSLMGKPSEKYEPVR